MSTLTMAPPVATARLSAGGLELEVERRGNGRPVVALHGITRLDPDAPFYAALAARGELVAPSMPGFGGSARPDDFDTVYDLAHLTLDVLQATGRPKAALVGSSFGGWVAAEAAAMSVEHVEKLVLIAPLGLRLGAPHEPDIAHLFNSHPRDLEAKAWADPSRRPRPVDGVGWQQHVQAMGEADIVDMARGSDALCTYGWRPHMYNPSLKHWLRRITCPTLVVWGAQDGIVTPAYGRTYASLIPNARFTLVEDAGHHPELEQPERTAALVEEFLA